MERQKHSICPNEPGVIEVLPKRFYSLNDLVEAADVYIKTKDVDIKANESKKISMDMLIEENIIKSDKKDKLKCDGYVIVKKKINKLDFSPYIKCDEYETME